jgi:uncharacterized protein (DUF1501 family)
MSTSRREFLRHGLGGVTLLASGLSMPGFLSRTARASALGPGGDRILVVVQLSGGNDGLNTVIPYADDLYHRARPTLRITPDRVLRLDDALGLHPDMTGFKRLFDRGLLNVVGGVGYPNPDRSHFRSMDIWHTASLRPEDSKDGWLGRAVGRLGAGDAAGALHLDDAVLPLALVADGQAVPSIRGIDAFRLAEGAGEIEAAVCARRPGAMDDLLFVQRTAVSSCRSARRLEQVAAGDQAEVEYPPYGLASRLRQMAQLIGAEFGARIYYTSMGGFDTHAKQVLAHGPLLRELSESVAAFYDDLERRGLADRVLLMTFSEFGRRVKENGSQGTDHGAGAPMFLAGPGCRPGLGGVRPDLAALEDGDVRFGLDFRAVYASILDGWLGVDSAAVLGQRFAGVELIKT